MDIRERIRRALQSAQQQGRQRGLSQRITGKDILPFQQQRQQIGQNVSNFMRQGITNIGNTRLENLPAPNLMPIQKLRSQVKAQPYTPTIREQFTNTIAQPITTAFDRNKSPFDRGVGAVQGAFNSTPIGQAWQIGTGGVAGVLKSRRTGAPLDQSIRQGISNPMADIATEGLGVQNPFLALGINVLSGNPKSAIKGIKGAKGAVASLKGINPKAFKMHPDDIQDAKNALDILRGQMKGDKGNAMKTVQNLLDGYAPGYKYSKNAKAYKVLENLIQTNEGLPQAMRTKLPKMGFAQADDVKPNVAKPLLSDMAETKVLPRIKPEPLPWEQGKKVPTAQMIDQQMTGGIKPQKSAVVTPADSISQNFAESMTLAGNSGKGGFKGLDSEVQDAYQGWVNSIKATPVEGFLKKKDFADLDSKGVNGIFEFQAGNKTGRYGDVKKFFDDKYKTLQKEGIDFNYKKDYLPQLWDNTQEEVQQVFGKNLSLRPSFSIDSIFKDYQEGIAKGLKPRFNSISDLAGWYEQRANKAIADKKFFTFLGEGSFITPANKAPQGWVTVDPDRFPKFSLNIDGDNYSGAFKAPPELAKIINFYLRGATFEPLTKIANYVSRVKNITLNFGIPGTGINMHGVNILARHTLMGSGGNPVSRWMTGIKYMVNPKSAEHELNKTLIRSPKAIKDGLTLSAEDYAGFGKQAENLAGQFSKKWENAFATPLFNKMIPTLKLSSYEELVKNGMDGKNAAKLVNNVYGGINWEQMGRDPNIQNFIRAIILAPDWAETTLRLGGNMAKAANPIHKSVVANRYRTMMATIFASYVAHNVVNKITSGHYSYENEGGHTFEIEMGYTDDGQKRYFRPYGTALDMVRLPYDIAKSAVKGDFSTTFRTIRNRASIPLGVVIGMATDQNYREQPIGYTGKDKFGNEVPLAQRVTGVGSEIASLVGVPAFSRQFLSTATGQQGIEQGITQGLELPFRYSNIGKSNIAKQVEPYTKDMKGKELYDFNKGLQGENKFSDNQIEFIKTGDKPNERVQQLIDKRAMNREADKKKEELKTTAGASGGSVSGDMVVTNDGDIIDLSPPTKGQGIGAFANKDWNITKARQVWNANMPQDEKEKAIKKLGLKPKDVRYDALANYDVDIKSQYLISKSPNKDKLYENLLTGRMRSIGDNIFASDGVIDNLYDEGYLTAAERKYFKSLDYNKDGTRKKGSGGKGKKPAKITPPAFKEAAGETITLSKPKLAQVKLEGRKQSKVKPQSVDNFKKELAEIEKRVMALV